MSIVWLAQRHLSGALYLRLLIVIAVRSAEVLDLLMHIVDEVGVERDHYRKNEEERNEPDAKPPVSVLHPAKTAVAIATASRR